MDTKYRPLILAKIQSYIDSLNKKDFSHDSSHIFRVERLAKRIGLEEDADMEIIEAASLLFDIARELEDKGGVEDHAQEGVEIAKRVLPQVEFPEDKIEPVCHAIFVHRRSKDRTPETLEAKILRDADYLDAMGAVDVARVIASSLQSKKYARPIYVEEEYNGKKDLNKSAIHFMKYKLEHPKHHPDSFYTETGKKLAKERYEFMRMYVKRFEDEWNGER